MTTDLLIDSVLVFGVILLAISSLTVRETFTAIVLFVGLGLLIALVWARLQAWDVAIAEAAIGAGLTGAMLLVAWRHLYKAEKLTGKRSDVS